MDFGIHTVISNLDEYPKTGYSLFTADALKLVWKYVRQFYLELFQQRFQLVKREVVFAALDAVESCVRDADLL